MKKHLTLSVIFCFVLNICNAQILRSFLELNDCRAIIQNNGFFGNNYQIGGPGYEIPKGSGNHTIYAFSPLWIGSVQGNLVGSAAVYEAENAFPGPVSSDYGAAWHSPRRSLRSVYKWDVDNHIQNWDDPGYVIPASILNWPAMGNPDYNTSEYIAPFVDSNNSGVYEPEQGDYPFVPGDQAIFSIYSYDVNPVDNPLNNNEFPLEVQVIAYQYPSSSQWLNRATFLNYRVLNKSNDTIKDFQWGAFADIDIGFAFDDYFGSDSARNLVYGYNGPNFDPGGGGQQGYGANPPAQGIVLLNKKLHTVNKLTYGETHDLNNLNDLSNLMDGRSSSGVPNTTSTGQPTMFLFNEPPFVENSESMYQLGMDPDIHRKIIAAEPIDLAPGMAECYHYAFVYGRNTSDHILSVEEVLKNTDSIQKFYDEQINSPCDVYFTTLNVQQFEKENEVKIFPNPANELVTIESNKSIKNIQIFSINGSKVYGDQLIQKDTLQLDISTFENGMYLLKIEFIDGDQSIKRLIKN